MRTKLGAFLLMLALALPTAVAAPAYADNEPCSEEGACQNRSGDCRETQEGSYCSDDDLSPSFEDSPVRDSFNPVVCLPMSTCSFDGQPKEEPT